MRGRNFPSWCVLKYSPGALAVLPRGNGPWFCWTQWLNSLEHITNDFLLTYTPEKCLFHCGSQHIALHSSAPNSGSRQAFSKTVGQRCNITIASATRWLLNRQTTNCKESMFQAFHHGVLCLSNPQNALPVSNVWVLGCLGPLHPWQFYRRLHGDPHKLHC